MSTTIKFINTKNNFVTEHQANNMNEFSKLFYINDVIKKHENYNNKELKGGLYYISPLENIIDVLTDVNNSVLKWSFMSNKQMINGYTVWDSKRYKQNFEQEPVFTKIVLDNKGMEVATVEYDSITLETKGAYKTFNYGGKPIPWAETNKYFPEDSEITFLFSPNGNIESIYMNYDILNNESHWKELNHFLVDSQEFFQQLGVTPEQLYYFTHVDPLVPDF